MKRPMSPIVALARRRVLKIIRELVEDLRKQASEVDDPHDHQDLMDLANLAERVTKEVFNFERLPLQREPSADQTIVSAVQEVHRCSGALPDLRCSASRI